MCAATLFRCWLFFRRCGVRYTFLCGGPVFRIRPPRCSEPPPLCPLLLLKITNQLLFQFQPSHFFAPEKFCWTLNQSHRNAFSRLTKALQKFVCRKPRSRTFQSWKKQKTPPVPLCCFLVTKQLYAFLYDCTVQHLHLWYVWQISLRKFYKVINFVIRFEALCL